MHAAFHFDPLRSVSAALLTALLLLSGTGCHQQKTTGAVSTRPAAQESGDRVGEWTGGVPVSVHVAPGQSQDGEWVAVLVGLSAPSKAVHLDLEVSSPSNKITKPAHVFDHFQTTVSSRNRNWALFQLQVKRDLPARATVVVTPFTNSDKERDDYDVMIIQKQQREAPEEEAVEQLTGGVPVSVHVLPDEVSHGQSAWVTVLLTGAPRNGRVDIGYSSPACEKDDVFLIAPDFVSTNAPVALFQVVVRDAFNDPCDVTITATTPDDATGKQAVLQVNPGSRP